MPVWEFPKKKNSQVPTITPVLPLTGWLSGVGFVDAPTKLGRALCKKKEKTLKLFISKIEVKTKNKKPANINGH